LKLIEPQPERVEGLSKLSVKQIRAAPAREPHAFPEASAPPTLPVSIRDEMVECYAFVFCQGGFRQLGMAFEQFLVVAAAIKPADLPANCEEAWTL
jgi:hypothetical protein